MDFSNLNFLDFLKYGALGVTLALAILSYRLLSTEQEKDQVREPMLKSIKTYLIFAGVLSMFFGVLELIGKSGSQDGGYDKAVSELWDRKFHGVKEDSTMNLKHDRLILYLDADLVHADTLKSFESVLDNLTDCECKLEDMNQGFYSKITQLRKSIDNDDDGWINVEHKPNEKHETLALVEEILYTLDVVDVEGQSNEQIIAAWKKYKATWDKPQKKYIFRSDVPVLVKNYLNKFHANAK